ncbi:hypothetical protein Moror_15585 [Moniliophthora roreri MCA 2997]|uniref:Uncharacterized protein n=1 Tax=Moniliophthora roreri (strain MCA 2997) TaxID=1381753 RepID=V2WSA9_MONRO|nr:hypothetical protein Moror_15585 [Moniliophthora roreri MCA 2997]
MTIYELQEGQKELEEGGRVAGEWDTRIPGPFFLVSNANAVIRSLRNTRETRHLTLPHPSQSQRTVPQPTAQKPPGELSWGFLGPLNPFPTSAEFPVPIFTSFDDSLPPSPPHPSS